MLEIVEKQKPLYENILHTYLLHNAQKQKNTEIFHGLLRIPNCLQLLPARVETTE